MQNFEILTSRRFEKELKHLAKHYPSLKTDYLRLIDELHENPNLGVDLGSGVRKVRMSISSKNKGKSGGARVITLNCLVDNNCLVLLSIYDKSERASVSGREVALFVREYQNGE